MPAAPVSISWGWMTWACWSGIWLSAVLLMGLQRWPSPPHKLELLLHFYPQAVGLWGSALGLLILVTLTRRSGARELLAIVLSLVLAGLLVLPLIPYWVPQADTATSEPVDSKAPALRMVLANVLFTNPDPQAFMAWLNTSTPHSHLPDLVIIEELNRAFETAMNQHPAYGYRHSVYTGDAFGIGVWSREPITVNTAYLGEAQLPSLAIHWQGVNLLATHPLPPIEARYFKARNTQYLALGQFLKDLSGPKILVGDLNITPWSGYYQALEKDNGLRNSRQGQGILPSWPSHWPAPLRIPIDHVLWQGPWQRVETRLGPDIGSDHLPVMAHFYP